MGFRDFDPWGFGDRTEEHGPTVCGSRNPVRKATVNDRIVVMANTKTSNGATEKTRAKIGLNIPFRPPVTLATTSSAGDTTPLATTISLHEHKRTEA